LLVVGILPLLRQRLACLGDIFYVDTSTVRQTPQPLAHFCNSSTAHLLLVAQRM
jgi:hypothetical protein